MIKSLPDILNLLTSKEKKTFKFLIFFMLLAGLLETIGLIAILPMINILTGNQTEFNFLESFLNKSGLFDNELSIAILIIFLVYFFKNLYLSVYYWHENKFAYKSRFNLGARLYTGYLDNPYIFHVKNNSSILITKILQESAIFGSAIISLSSLITESIIIIAIMTLLVMVKPLETLWVIGIIGFLSIIFYITTSKIAFRLGKILVKTQKLNMQVLKESLNSIKDIIMFRANKYFSNSVTKRSMEIALVGFKNSFLNRLPRIWFEMTAIIIISMIIIFPPIQSSSNLNILGTLGVFLISTIKILPSMSKILVSLQQIRHTATAIKSLKEDFKTIDFYRDKNQHLLNSKQELKFNKEVKFSDVSFSYSSKDNRTIKNISLSIKKNDFIAIIGKSGSGKTTLLNLLMGLIPVSSGKILVDGIEIDKNLKSWRKNIGYVPQNIYLIDDSVKKNIAFGFENHEILENKLLKSIDNSNLKDFIVGLGNKADTLVGEDASKISGGQKQRIALARALYNDPSILILDEPLSSLDQKTSEDILDNLKRLNKTKTIIMVTHKLEKKSIFSKVYEINNNTISEVK